MVVSLYFQTGVPPLSATFQTGVDRGSFVFSTGVTPLEATFAVTGDTSNLLTVTLSDNHQFILVYLDRKFRDSYTLDVLEEGSYASPVSEKVKGGWAIPVGEDGVWYLTVKDGEGLVIAQAATLVNYKSLHRLAQYRKGITPKLHEHFERLSYYNGLAILFYECGEFVKAREMLTLLLDISL